MTTHTDEVVSPVREGDVLAGKYRVEKVLGAGGMGVVVAAKHLELRQRVALKFLLPAALDSVEHTERFLREAQAAVRLKSEHVAKVLDVGRLDDGAPYIVMEYLDGSDLWHVLQAKGPLSVGEATGHVLQACEALAEAHALGIVHRDLKPQNLFLIQRPDGQPCVKVLDFGISKMLSTASQPPLTLTRTSTIIGSPLYMAPEQMRSAKGANERSDIWSLGVILYELLTGRTPFMAETMPDLVFKVAQDTVIPPRELRAEIPETLSAGIVRCLERDQKVRFANVAELAAVLEKYAPDYQRGTADRISNVLRVASVPPPVSLRAAVPVRAVAGSATGNSAWGTTQNTPPNRKRAITTVAIVAGLVGLAGGAGVIALRGSDRPASAAAPVSASTSTSTSTSTPTPTATSTPTPTATATPTTTASASADPSASAAPKPSARPPVGAAPTKPPAAPASGPPRAWD